jgi:hypothetical protein
MSKEFSTRTSFAIALAMVLAAPAFAAKKDDLYKQAQTAAAAGRVEEAARLYCDTAAEDPAYRDAKQLCTIFTQEAAREARRNAERFNDGVALFNSGDYDGAEQKFRNVKAGTHVAEAQAYVSTRIPTARAAAKTAGEEVAANKKFDEAIQAYNSNNFSSARTLFQQVAGKRQGEAQSYVQKMQQYEQAMNEGDRLAAANDARKAISSYTDAANLKGDGPGDPRGRISRMQQMLATQGQPAPTPAPPPVQAKPVPVAPVTAAIKDTGKKIDVAKLLREAEAAKDRGEIVAARGKYLAILAQDAGNAQARIALESLKSVNTGSSSGQKAGSEADVMLAKGIGEFYQRLYERSEVHISDYLDINGSKAGLALFYRGASKLTRYYLSGEAEAQKSLLAEAKKDLAAAKKTAGFKAPGQQYVSPKILKVYNDL